LRVGSLHPNMPLVHDPSDLCIEFVLQVGSDSSSQICLLSLLRRLPGHPWLFVLSRMRRSVLLLGARGAPSNRTEHASGASLVVDAGCEQQPIFSVEPLFVPASGTDPHEGQLDYAVWFTPQGDARSNRLPHHVRRALRAALFGPNEPDLDDLANSVMLVDRDDVQVIALKPAFQGDV